MGCIARANPYDVRRRAHEGERRLVHLGVDDHALVGTVHGVFHSDGTIRDPTIVAALLGMFRDRHET